jgi:hypothetical protein
MNSDFFNKLNTYNSSDESDSSSESENENENENNNINNNTKKKSTIQLYFKFQPGEVKTIYNKNLKNKNITKFVNIHNTKNTNYFDPDKYKVSTSNCNLRYLQNSDIYETQK